MNSKNPGLILALASPLAFTCFNVGVRLITADTLSIWGLLFLRGCIGATLVYLVARALKKSLWGRNRGLLMLIGLSGFLSTACTTTAITLIPLFQAVVILYLYPSWAIILSALLNQESVQLRDALGVALALFGCILLIWPDESAGLSLKAGHLVGLLGSFLYGLGFVFTRRLGDDNSGLEPIFHYSLFAALGALPLSLAFGAKLGISSVAGIWAGLALGAVGSLAQMMGYAALRWLPAYKVGVLGTLEVLGGVLGSWLVFNDPMTARAVLGGALIIFVAFGIRPKSSKPAALTNAKSRRTGARP
jgi:drug/metabolite transporter (DMT)-like permease